MKNIKLYTLLALLLMAGGAFAQSFTSVCETGQNLQYAVTSVDPPEVTIERCLDYFGGVTIPDTVEYDNTKYAVVAIGFRNRLPTSRKAVLMNVTTCEAILLFPSRSLTSQAMAFPGVPLTESCPCLPICGMSCMARFLSCST